MKRFGTVESLSAAQSNPDRWSVCAGKYCNVRLMLDGQEVEKAIWCDYPKDYRQIVHDWAWWYGLPKEWALAHGEYAYGAAWYDMYVPDGL